MDQSNFSFSEIQEFTYSISKRELLVNEIFIRFYNNPEDKFSPVIPESFGLQIIEKLSDYMSEKLNSSNEKNCI